MSHIGWAWGSTSKWFFDVQFLFLSTLTLNNIRIGSFCEEDPLTTSCQREENIRMVLGSNPGHPRSKWQLEPIFLGLTGSKHSAQQRLTFTAYPATAFIKPFSCNLPTLHIHSETWEMILTSKTRIFVPKTLKFLRQERVLNVRVTSPAILSN